MKIVFATFLIIGFASIAVFGAFAMNHGSGYSHSGCLAAVAQGGNCPEEGGVLSFIAFHLKVLRGFSTAIFDGNSASALILLIILALSVIFGIFAKNNPALPVFAAHCYRGQFLKFRFFSRQQELVRWLAFHENSPAVS